RAGDGAWKARSWNDCALWHGRPNRPPMREAAAPRKSAPERAFRSHAGGRSGLSFPDLRATDPGKADVAAHIELLAPIEHRELDLVDLAALGVEDVAAVPDSVVLVHAPHDVHAFDRLVLALAIALLAQCHRAIAGDVFRTAVEQFHDVRLQLAVVVGDLHDRLGLAALVIDGLPGADRGVVGRECGAGGEQQAGGDGKTERWLHGAPPVRKRMESRLARI